MFQVFKGVSGKFGKSFDGSLRVVKNLIQFVPLPILWILTIPHLQDYGAFPSSSRHSSLALTGGITRGLGLEPHC